MTFDIYIGVKRKDRFHVDLVVDVVLTDDVEVVPPANALDLPKLHGSLYRLYPVVDQIADKVCATLAHYNGRASTREKDLVDLVLLALTQDVDAHKLRRALEAEARVRSLVLPTVFQVPDSWGARYARLAAKSSALSRCRTIDAAMGLMRSFLGPVFAGQMASAQWDHTRRRWVERPTPTAG